MEEQDWKNIISELSEQIGQLSIERAVARADAKKAIMIIDAQKAEIERLNNEINAIAQPLTVNKKE